MIYNYKYIVISLRRCQIFKIRRYRGFHYLFLLFFIYFYFFFFILWFYFYLFSSFIFYLGGVHGAPLGTADIAHVKKTFNYNPAEVSWYVEWVVERSEVDMYGLSIANRELERKSYRERCLEGEREKR